MARLSPSSAMTATCSTVRVSEAKLVAVIPLGQDPHHSHVEVDVCSFGQDAPRTAHRSHGHALLTHETETGQRRVQHRASDRFKVVITPAEQQLRGESVGAPLSNLSNSSNHVGHRQQLEGNRARAHLNRCSWGSSEIASDHQRQVKYLHQLAPCSGGNASNPHHLVWFQGFTPCLHFDSAFWVESVSAFVDNRTQWITTRLQPSPAHRPKTWRAKREQ